MLRLVVILAVLGLLSCGQEPAGEAGEMGEVGMPSEAGETPESVDRCLDLVDGGDFDQAVDVCARAAREAPENQEVADALEKARGEVEAAAEEAASAAEEGAEGAESAAEESMP